MDLESLSNNPLWHTPGEFLLQRRYEDNFEIAFAAYMILRTVINLKAAS